MSLSNENQNPVISQGFCCDNYCNSVITYNTNDPFVVCAKCGRKQESSSLKSMEQTASPKELLTNIIVQRIQLNRPRGSEMLKVLGLSNFYCKMLSPLLTRYGMDKGTGKAKLLTEMNQGEIFDCSLFGDRAFLIEPEHVSISGYGRDDTGSMIYLAETLKLIKAANGNEERLVPIYTDGDGHCLVHAISRALVGRELFWHPLRCCLKKHFQANLMKYKELFKDFVDSDEWDSIINECDPDFKPPEGEFHGLRNIHIFGFANILRRPIILLDSYECMKKSADYSAIFLPCLVDPDDCKSKDGSLNKPICIAWSSFSHNHYIPLVGIKNRPLPVLPSALVPTVWGLPQNLSGRYIEFENGNCTIGGGRPLSDAYIHRLVGAMEVLFCEKSGVHPSLVYDFKHNLCQNFFPNADLSAIIARTRSAVEEGRLYRCTFCESLCEWQIPQDWLRYGGILYNQALCKYGTLRPGETYELNAQVNQLCNLVLTIKCKYDAAANKLVLQMNETRPEQCPQCGSYLKRLKYDGSTVGGAIQEEPSNLSKAEEVSTSYVDQSESRKKFDYDAKRMEDTTPLPEANPEREELIKRVSDLGENIIQKHLPDEAANKYLWNVVCKEIHSLIGIIEASAAEAGSSNSSNYDKSNSEKLKKKLNEIKNNEIQREQISVTEPQYVKVCTSHGDQANLALHGKSISYPQLQEWIKNQFKIPVSRQRIKHGFPPKVLQPSGSNNQTLPLKHGDRLTVEILQKGEEDLNIENSMSQESNRSIFGSRYSGRIEDFQYGLIWSHAIMNPHDFEKGGMYYETIAQSTMLHIKTHADLKDFPNKRFCYNPVGDRIEICIKSLGHFRIVPDLEHRIDRVKHNDTSVEGFSKCPLTSSQKEQKSNKNPGRTIPSPNAETKEIPYLRKGPGFSILTSPKPSDVEKMDIN
ncbi:deubiquitinating protein VCPIP1-like [Uloborus diversus]|uniref:deubiquitinating protein VCPIP1-like n=1 Tax=Uloborus diversus TaxID=327109 RepID=UPI002409BC64|nr:deubiquitinating protein VCPIP1-like [Uloborus diversus]XP_054710219.1 deubiquitinating protein VCPIP1-like [Uloborus diversus]